MRIEYVMQLARQYLVLGLTAAMLTLLIMIVCFAFYRKYFQKSDTIPWVKFIIMASLVCYFIIVIGATMLSRGQYETRQAILRPFETYRYAWFKMDMVYWRNLVLNILMFCPIGFLLPIIHPVFRKYYVVYATGFGCTFFIELAQFIFRCGVFETDDLINNTLGAMIGFGLYSLLVIVREWIMEEKKNILKTVLLQIPLMFSFVLFLMIALVYQTKSLGNLMCCYTHKHKISDLSITASCEISQERKTAEISKVYTYSQQEAYNYAQNVLWGTGKRISSMPTFYDKNAYFQSEDGTATIWFDYVGGTFSYEDYSQHTDSHGFEIAKKVFASKEQIEVAVKQLGLELPEQYIFSNLGNGNYRLNGLQTEKGGPSGVINCTYTTNDMISSLEYYITKGEVCYEKEIYSEKEIYDKLKKGRFSEIYNTNDEEIQVSAIKEMNVKSIELNYVLDSKGYFQPVYVCKVSCDGVDGSIELPALR